MKSVEVTYKSEYLVKFSDSTASSHGVKTETVSMDAESLEPILKQLGVSKKPIAISIFGRVEEDDYSGTIDLIDPLEITITFEDGSDIYLSDRGATDYQELRNHLSYTGRLNSLWHSEIMDREKKIEEYRKSLRGEE
jgi:hypothetical protein